MEVTETTFCKAKAAMTDFQRYQKMASKGGKKK